MAAAVEEDDLRAGATRRPAVAPFGPPAVLRRLPVVAVRLDVVVPTVRPRIGRRVPVLRASGLTTMDGPVETKARTAARLGLLGLAPAAVRPEAVRPRAAGALAAATVAGHAPWVAEVASGLAAVGTTAAVRSLAASRLRRIA